MTNGLIGRKLGMTRVFAEDGTAVPVTVIEAGPCPVVQVARGRACSSASEPRKAKRTTKARAGPRQEGGARGGAAACCASFPLAGEAPKPGDAGDGGDLRRRASW